MSLNIYLKKHKKIFNILHPIEISTKFSKLLNTKIISTSIGHINFKLPVSSDINLIVLITEYTKMFNISKINNKENEDQNKTCSIK